MNFQVEKIIKGDKRALEIIMDTYIEVVYYLIKAILNGYGTKEDIEECVQDTFIKFWNNARNFDKTKGSLKSYILIMARSEALNKRKKLKEKPKVIDIEEVLVKDRKEVESLVLEKQNRIEILKAINTLGTLDREIFIKKYFYNKKIKDIAEEVSLSISAIENRLWRGREKLRLYLNENGEGKAYNE